MIMFRTLLMCMVIAAGVSWHPSTLGDATPSATFACPVTEPTGERPDIGSSPFPEDATLHYQDGLWVSIPEDGIIELTQDDAITFGPLVEWRSQPVTWLRDKGVEGFVEVTGQRLDAESEFAPQTPLSPQRQYIRVGSVTTGLAFPSEGCWEVTGSVGEHGITWIMEVRFVDSGSAFVCPVTFPNTSELMGLPKNPGDGMVYNETDLWIAIPANGVLEFDPELHGESEDPEFEGWLGFKLHVHRGADAKGNVTITGQRLDAPSDLEPANILGVEDSYRDMGFLPVSLMIPEEGCWELTATAGDSSATWVVDVRYVEEPVATPQPSS